MKCEQIITNNKNLHDLEECVKFYRRDSKKNKWIGFNKYGDILIDNVEDINVFTWLADNSVSFVDKIELEEKEVWPKIYASSLSPLIFKENEDKTVDVYMLNSNQRQKWKFHEDWTCSVRAKGKHRKLLLRLFEDIVE